MLRDPWNASHANPAAESPSDALPTITVPSEEIASAFVVGPTPGISGSATAPASAVHRTVREGNSPLLVMPLPATVEPSADTS